jgi:hypothetical protein
VDDVAEEAPAVVDVPALGEQARPIRKVVLDRVVVEKLVGIRAGLAAALALGLDRPSVLAPAADIEIVNQPVQEEAAIEPGEAMEAVISGQFALAVALVGEGDNAVLAIGPAGDEIADAALV